MCELVEERGFGTFSLLLMSFENLGAGLKIEYLLKVPWTKVHWIEHGGF